MVDITLACRWTTNQNNCSCQSNEIQDRIEIQLSRLLYPSMCPWILCLLWYNVMPRKHSGDQNLGCLLFISCQPYNILFHFVTGVTRCHYKPQLHIARCFSNARFRNATPPSYILVYLHLVALTTVERGQQTRRNWKWITEQHLINKLCKQLLKNDTLSNWIRLVGMNPLRIFHLWVAYLRQILRKQNFASKFLKSDTNGFEAFYVHILALLNVCLLVLTAVPLCPLFGTSMIHVSFLLDYTDLCNSIFCFLVLLYSLSL